MSLQFISDSSGETTGVFVQINEWNDLKNKFKGIDQEEVAIPDWHKEIVRQRLEDYKKNPELAMEFGDAMDDIEKELLIKNSGSY